MQLTIDFTPQEAAWLHALAQQQGIPPAEIVKRLVDETIPALAEPPEYRTPEARIQAIEALAEINRTLPVLPEAAFDRETLYSGRL